MTTHQLATSSTYQVMTSTHQLPECGQAKPLITMRSLCWTGLPHSVCKGYRTTPQIITQRYNACLLTPYFTTGSFVLRKPVTPGSLLRISLRLQTSSALGKCDSIAVSSPPPLKVKLCVCNVYFLWELDTMLCYLNAEHHPQREQNQFSEEIIIIKKRTFSLSDFRTLQQMECASTRKEKKKKVCARNDQINTRKQTLLCCW